jgi:competence ComEA-like helix-hairpin-helix protein
MARISLRAYNADIETMIDRDQSDEAIAHCRYILERFPKHIDTYRLMGKALLEGHRFGDASDVFHRVLSSVPDDFIAHLGMSIIREDEGNIDAAIWHMERSFEVQPSNAAVQVELRRLYNLRDGLTPQKIQLTRGALARMSAKSNLYSQAIAELRAALSDDPQRPDLQVVLATMYAQSGSRIEAIETCNTLLGKLPYCFEANRILAEILPETERAERAQEYRNRLNELDPYYAHLSPVSPTVAQVTDNAVTLEKLDYSGELLDSTTPEQPEWAASLGVTIDDELETEEETPPWMVTESEEILPTEEIPDEGEIEPAAETESDEAQVEQSEEEPLPDWMTEPDVEEQSTESDETETPEWLREVMEGSGADEISQTEAAAGIEAGVEETWDEEHETEIPVGLDESLAAESKESETEISDETVPTEDDMPVEEEDREKPLAGIAPTVGAVSDELVAGAAVAGAALGATRDDEQPEIPDSEEEISGEETQPADTTTPDHLDEEIASDEAVEITEDEGEVPGWLRDLGEGVPDEDQPELEVETALAGELISAEPDASQELDEEIEPESAFDELVDEGEAGEVEAEPEPKDELIESVDLSTDEPVPLDDAEILEPESIDEIEAETEIEIEEIESAFQFETTQQPGEGEFPDTLPDWLSAVSPEEEGEAAEPTFTELDEQDEIVRAEIPDWLQKMEKQHLAEMAAAAKVTEQLDELELEPEFTDLSGEDVPSWLMSAMSAEISEEVDDIQPVEDIEEIIPMPEVTQVEPLEPILEDELIPDSDEEIEVITEQVMDEESIPDATEDEIKEEIIADELIGIEEEVLESDTQPVMVGESAEVPALEDDLELEETPTAELTEVEAEIHPEIEVMEEIEAESTEEEEAPDLGTEISSEPEVMEEFEAESAEAEEVPELGAEISPEPEVMEEVESAVAEEAPELAAEIHPEIEVMEEIEAESGEVEEAPELSAEISPETELIEEIEAESEVIEEAPELEREILSEPEAIEQIEVEIAEMEEKPELAAEIHPELEEMDEIEAESEEVEEAPEVAAETPISTEDEDAAIAWLESLAARQGAAEEELLTEPEERHEEPPGWIQEEVVQMEDSQDEEPELIDDLAKAAVAGAAIAAISRKEEQEPTEEVAPMDEGKMPPSEGPEWIPELDQELEKLPETEEAEPALEIESEPELEFGQEIDQPEIMDAGEEKEPAEELPKWLTDYTEEEEVSPEYQTTDWSPDMLVEDAEVDLVTKPESDVKIDLNAASLRQLEKIPGVGFIHAQNIINYRVVYGPFNSLDELAKIPDLNPEVIEILKANLTVEMVSDVSPPVSAHSDLTEAWKSLDSGEIEIAVRQYNEFIKNDDHLDEVIRDLQEALGKYPQDASLHQALGDAYLHANMLQEALDAYSRAEDLIG